MQTRNIQIKHIHEYKCQCLSVPVTMADDRKDVQGLTSVLIDALIS